MTQKALIKIKDKEILRKDSFEYEVYNITPSRFNIESSKSFEEILNTMSAITEEKLKFDYLSKSIVLNKTAPFYYEILYEGKSSIKFNYIIPNKYSKVLVNKIDRVFRTSSVKKCEEDYFSKFINTYYCEFQQAKHFMYSLNSDYRESGLLDGLMSVINNMQEDDFVLLQIGILPISENKWKEQWKIANMKQKSGEELIIHTNPVNFVLDNLFSASENFLDIFDHVMGVDTKTNEKVQKQMDKMGKWRDSHFTIQKINYNGYEVQIRVYCTNGMKTRYYGRIFDSIFKVLDADQELEIGKIKQHKSKDREFKIQFSKQIWSTKELAHVFRLPDRKMQLDFKESLQSIQVTENAIPKELQDSNSIPIGETTYKGTKIDTYFPTEVSMKAMCLTVCGPSRAGKTTLLKNMIISAIKSGESCFVLDTIRQCELVQDIRDYLPQEYKDKLVILDYSNLNYILPLAFNELLDIDFKDKISQMMVASHLTGALTGYINSISGVEDQLSSRMRKYIACSGKLVMSQKNTTIRDVFDVLEDYNIREKFIKSSGLNENNNLIQELRHLDDGKGGTNYSLISGIIDRISILLNDYTSEVLLSTQMPENSELNFTKWSLEGKCVLIKLSDEVFSREALAPLITFLFFKIWLSVGTARSKIHKPRMTRVFLDEIHNYPIILSFLSDKVKEAAKFMLSFTISCHYLSDAKRLLPTLKAVGGNFMMLGGTSRENFKLMEPELLQHDISLEEAMLTKPFHSLNLINYNRQYIAYTSKMPPMLDKLYKKYDRSGLDLECSKKYGVPFEG